MAAAAMENISSESIPGFRNKANFHSRYDKLKNLLHDPSTAELLKNLSQVFQSERNNQVVFPYHESPYQLYIQVGIKERIL